MSIIRLNPWAIALCLLGASVFSTTSHAVPSFARQTGLECTACHISWPELTTVGRQFKLGGYTLMKPVTQGERPWVSFDRDTNPPIIPLAGFFQASASSTGSTNSAGTSSDDFPRQNELMVQQLSLFLAGRVNDHAGGFIQWSYDGLEKHSAMDNVDLRLTNRYQADNTDVLYGLSLNNSPTMSDIYNTTPVWGFPFASSSVAPTPAASAVIQEGLAQQVAGLNAYALWNRTVYAEVGAYRTADGMFSAFRAGQDLSTAAQLKDTAPYWRLALQHEWDEGTQSVMVGAFGLDVSKYPDPTDLSTPVDQFRDRGIDAQYQYVGDTHRMTTQLSYIQEDQNLNGSFAAGGASNIRNTLDVMSLKFTYYFQTKYGVSLGYQRIRGSNDDLLYNTGSALSGSASASPDSAAYILEFNWLPLRDKRITLQYTAYDRFNGGTSNYDGFGRNASDNNTLYLLGWFMF